LKTAAQKIGKPSQKSETASSFFLKSVPNVSTAAASLEGTIQVKLTCALCQPGIKAPLSLRLMIRFCRIQKKSSDQNQQVV
jgi:hypothetical protein